jgi:hypothetical protein
MKQFRRISLTILAVFLTTCKGTPTKQPAVDVVGQKVSVAGGSYKVVSVTELDTMLANKDFTFINVHVPFEGNIG